MIECDWTQAPTWANYFVELEGSRYFWSETPYTEFLMHPQFNCSISNMPTDPVFDTLSVVQCVARPEWKTLIHFKEAGKLTTYEAEGKLAHGTVKREIISQLGVDKNTKFMLEYVQIN